MAAPHLVSKYINKDIINHTFSNELGEFLLKIEEGGNYLTLSQLNFTQEAIYSIEGKLCLMSPSEGYVRASRIPTTQLNIPVTFPDNLKLPYKMVVGWGNFLTRILYPIPSHYH